MEIIQGSRILSRNGIEVSFYVFMAYNQIMHDLVSWVEIYILQNSKLPIDMFGPVHFLENAL